MPLPLLHVLITYPGGETRCFHDVTQVVEESITHSTEVGIRTRRYLKIEISLTSRRSKRKNLTIPMFEGYHSEITIQED